MELDQLLFKRVYNYIARKQRKTAAHDAFGVDLESIKSRLLILSRALSGEPLEIFASEREGGWRDGFLFLPERCSLFPSQELNHRFYFFRLLYLLSQRKLGFNWDRKTNEDSKASQHRAESSAPKVLEHLFARFPAMEEAHSSFLDNLPVDDQGLQDRSWIYGRWMSGKKAGKQDAFENVSVHTQTTAGDISTEIKARQADEVEVVLQDKKAQEDFTLTHNFEKVETIDEFNGIWRNFDGDDTLADDQQALSDYNLKQMVRVDDPVHSVYRAQMAQDTTIPDSEDVDFEGSYTVYPEWDHRLKAYREAHCKVFTSQLIQDDTAYFHDTLRENKRLHTELRKTFAKINNDFEIVKRQISGDHIDIDAVTERYADMHVGRTPSEKVYTNLRKRSKDISLLFLLDLSLSADGYAKGNRIIDIEKQVSILFGEVLHEYGIDFAISGFYSKTRHKSMFMTLKGFDQDWKLARNRIGYVQPEGYTRIGPAIRHATSLLNTRQCKKKWLILLSDGKPNDYDRYEGRYGMYDIKQALRELNVHGINSYALAIEEEAKYYLPQMFGHNHYSILSTPADMIHALTKLYERIERS